MMPAAVFVQAEDEILGVLVAEVGGMKEHDIRLIEGYGGEAETVGQVTLPFQIGSRAGDEQAARVVVQIRALRVIH